MTEPSAQSLTPPPAEFLIRIQDGATALCARHAVAFQHIMLSAGHHPEIWEVDPDEEPMTCQACHLSNLGRPRILLPH